MRRLLRFCADRRRHYDGTFVCRWSGMSGYVLSFSFLPVLLRPCMVFLHAVVDTFAVGIACVVGMGTALRRRRPFSWSPLELFNGCIFGSRYSGRGNMPSPRRCIGVDQFWQRMRACRRPFLALLRRYQT